MLFGNVYHYMPTCKHCGGTFETEQLIRHEYDGRLLMVHCPNCHMVMGTYRTESPRTDTRRSDRMPAAPPAEMR